MVSRDHHTYHDPHEPYYIKEVEYDHPKEVVYDEPREVVYDVVVDDDDHDFEQEDKRTTYEYYEEKGKPWTWRTEGQQYPQSES